MTASGYIRSPRCRQSWFRSLKSTVLDLSFLHGEVDFREREHSQITFEGESSVPVEIIGEFGPPVQIRVA